MGKMNIIGKDTKVWDYCSIIDSIIGDNVNIGNCCEVYKAIIGDNSRIGFGSFICEGVSIGKNCFIGPRVCFTNDKYPVLNEKKHEILKTVVGDYATIGANVTILPGINIGKFSLIGAGSVVTKDVPDFCIVYGNPAKSPTQLQVRVQ